MAAEPSRPRASPRRGRPVPGDWVVPIEADRYDGGYVYQLPSGSATDSLDTNRAVKVDRSNPLLVVARVQRGDDYVLCLVRPVEASMKRSLEPGDLIAQDPRSSWVWLYTTLQHGLLFNGTVRSDEVSSARPRTVVSVIATEYPGDQVLLVLWRGRLWYAWRSGISVACEAL